MGGHIWGDAGNVEVRLRGTLHRRTVLSPISSSKAALRKTRPWTATDHLAP